MPTYNTGRPPASSPNTSEQEVAVPASRSRTGKWKDYLAKIRDRGGALEISVLRAGDNAEPDSADLVWRVKVIDFDDNAITIEPPAAFGRTIPLGDDVRLIGAMTIGQNRWMFHTRTLGKRVGHRGEVILLELPDNVERCTRRNAYRMSTADLNLPVVQCWPLRDPSSVVAGEAANRGQILQAMDGDTDSPAPIESLVLPDVGAAFDAHLVNISGGGLGIKIDSADASGTEHSPYLWLRVNLLPHIPLPLAVTARIAHTHRDVTQSIYAGLAFDFTHNPEHRRFVVDVLESYVDRVQERQRNDLAKAS